MAPVAPAPRRNENAPRRMVALVLPASWPQPRADGQALAPLRNLPPYMRVLVDWGVRPEWSLDGKSLLFMERGLGDAYRLDVETGRVTPLTAHFYNQGFDRVLALANGDYLLTGPRAVDPKDPWNQRHTGFEMFVLDRGLAKPPVPLGERLDEGPAVSRTRMHVAWTTPGQRKMFEADIVYADGLPALANRRLVLSYESRPATERLETQDFRPPDEKELLFTCYSGTVEEPFYFADLCGIDLARGTVTNYTNTPEQYDEAEGAFPPWRQPAMEDRRLPLGAGWQQSCRSDHVLPVRRQSLSWLESRGEPGRAPRRRAVGHPRDGRGPGARHRAD
jgi:hypothetical protein